MKRLWFIHPLLWAAFPILFLYAQNAELIRPAELAEPILISLTGAVAITLLLTLILHSLGKAALLATLFISLFFSFGHVSGALPEVQESLWGVTFGTEDIVAAVWVTIFIVSGIIIFKTRGQLEKTTAILGQLGLFLMVIQIIHGGYTLAARFATQPELPEMADFDYQQEKRPDIYFIVMDAFGRSDILREIYNVDNSDFIDHLRSRGFFVADTSHANYFRTVMSLASTLNMNYLNQSLGFDPEIRDKNLLPERLDENQVFKIFRKLGYTIVSFDKTGSSNTEQLPVDIRLSVAGGLSEFETTLIATSTLKLFFQKSKTEQNLHRRMVVSTLNKLGHITEVHSPKFVFAHVLSPHRPFVFGPDGKHVPKDKYRRVNRGGRFVPLHLRDQYITAYADQAIHIGTVLKKVVDDILDSSPENPPIIIIQGDHGPRSGLDWHDANNSDLKECFSILNAIYLPGVNSSPLYHGISSVNTFRVIFNTYFGTDLKILPDDCIFARSGYVYPNRLISPEELTSNREPHIPTVAPEFETLTTLDRLRRYERKMTDHPLSDCYVDSLPMMTFNRGKLELADCRLKESGNRKYTFEAVFIPHGLAPKDYTIQLVFQPRQREIVRESDRQGNGRTYTFSAKLPVEKMKDDLPTFVKYHITVPFVPEEFEVSIFIPGRRPPEYLTHDGDAKIINKIYNDDRCP
ncbi:MAG: LTA synthase family protein [FCB group bacterium]|nr:LTA synthase family protein [FCB group bacterium]